MQRLLAEARVLPRLLRRRRFRELADVGAGGGWFTVRLARRVGPNGTVFAQDVQAQIARVTRQLPPNMPAPMTTTSNGYAPGPCAASISCQLLHT